MLCGDFRNQLERENDINNAMVRICERIAKIKNPLDRDDEMK